MRRILRAYPTMLRVGLAEAVAYRAEFVVWMLTTTMPLVNLAIWTAVARSAGPVGPGGQWGQAEFVAYFLGAFIVRTLTGSWVVWEINQEVRAGTLSMRLLKPVHPMLHYTAEHLAAIPLRAAMALPIGVVLLALSPGHRLVTDPERLAILAAAIAGAWLIMFASMCAIGTLSMYLQKSIGVFEVWWGLFAVASGYLVPLPLMPAWVERVAAWLPFRYMLAFPVELLINLTSRGEALRLLAVQWAWALGLLLVALGAWRTGVRRYEAFGA